jgi:protein-disulfide isomerase
MSSLTPPIGSRDHILGSADAPVTLVEYGDYECPYCLRAHPIVASILRRLGDSIRFGFRHFPLSQAHPHAQSAAEAAEAAAGAGKFWEMHDQLFQNQNALENEDLIGYAARIGIDPDQVAQALATHVFAARVRQDFISGVRSGVNGTPTFFINGLRHDGPWDEATLLEALESNAAKFRMTLER